MPCSSTHTGLAVSICWLPLCLRPRILLRSPEGPSEAGEEAAGPPGDRQHSPVSILRPWSYTPLSHNSQHPLNVGAQSSGQEHGLQIYQTRVRPLAPPPTTYESWSKFLNFSELVTGIVSIRFADGWVWVGWLGMSVDSSWCFQLPLKPF